MEGYAADFSAWARVNEKHEPEKTWGQYRDLPQHEVSFLVERLRELQVRRALPRNNETIREDIKTLIGPCGSVIFPAPAPRMSGTRRS